MINHLNIQKETESMVKGSMTTCSAMTEYETLEAFVEGAKKSSSAAMELAKECDDPTWREIAGLLQALGINGLKLSKMRSMSRLEKEMAMAIKMNGLRR